MDVIGIDVGGTKIKAGIINTDGQISHVISKSTPVVLGREGVLALVIEIIQQLRAVQSKNIKAVGIGAAGRIDKKTGRVLFATDNLPGWTGTHVKSTLETSGSLPVFVENDVNAAALGEGWLGASQGFKHYVLITLGTGVGGALVHDGQLINGPRGGTGEFGHMILYPVGIQCNCGQMGCLEQYVSGNALDRLAKGINRDWNSVTLMKGLGRGDPRAMEKIEMFITDLAVFLVSLQNMYDPELIVLGGGVVDSHPLWWEKLKERIGEMTLHQLLISPAKLGNYAGMIGAARLAFDEMK